MRPLLALLLLLATPALAQDYTARVVGVTDGDTLTVLRNGHERIKVRLAEIDAPETGQPFGTQAKRAASDLAFGKDVTVRPHATDRYGRTVAEVILPGGKDMGHSLVEAGYAWQYLAYSHDPVLAHAQADAQAAHRGLWSQPNPIPPWDWRRGRNVPVTAEVVGNRRSHVYHGPACRAVAVMRAENRVEFGTGAEAEEKGYRRARDCD